MVDNTDDNASAGNDIQQQTDPITRVNKNAPKYMYPRMPALHGRSSWDTLPEHGLHLCLGPGHGRDITALDRLGRLPLRLTFLLAILIVTLSLIHI